MLVFCEINCFWYLKGIYNMLFLKDDIKVVIEKGYWNKVWDFEVLEEN